MKVTIISSVSQKLRSKRIEMDEDFCKSRNIQEFKEGSVEIENPDAYLIKPKNTTFAKAYWIAKDDVTVLPDIKDTLDRWA